MPWASRARSSRARPCGPSSASASGVSEARGCGRPSRRPCRTATGLRISGGQFSARARRGFRCGMVSRSVIDLSLSLSRLEEEGPLAERRSEGSSSARRCEEDPHPALSRMRERARRRYLIAAPPSRCSGATSKPCFSSPATIFVEPFGLGPEHRAAAIDRPAIAVDPHHIDVATRAAPCLPRGSARLR